MTDSICTILGRGQRETLDSLDHPEVQEREGLKGPKGRVDSLELAGILDRRGRMALAGRREKEDHRYDSSTP